jgi:hypothetical protein
MLYFTFIRSELGNACFVWNSVVISDANKLEEQKFAAFCCRFHPIRVVVTVTLRVFQLHASRKRRYQLDAQLLTGFALVLKYCSCFLET